ncbi:hypothetical protein BH23VER1_BH23VER1_12190 [soil metagenome]
MIPKPAQPPPAETDEMIRAIRAATIGITGASPVTFGREDDLAGFTAAAWRTWLEGAFLDLHAPALAASYRCVAEGDIRGVNEIDRRYGQDLVAVAGAGVAAASQRAGANVLQAMPGARAIRPLERLRAAAEAGEIEAHFAVMFGAHAAVFHVPLAASLVALAYLEWKRGGGLATARSEGDDVEECFAREAVGTGLHGLVAKAMAGGAQGAPNIFAACA